MTINRTAVLPLIMASAIVTGLCANSVAGPKTQANSFILGNQLGSPVKQIYQTIKEVAFKAA